MVYLLQHKYCLRCVQKTGESFPVCCIVASQLSPAREWCCPNNLWSTSGRSVSLSVAVPLWLCGVVCAVCWDWHRHGTGGSWAGVNAPLSLALSYKPAQGEGAVTQRCRWLEEAHSPFDAADNKWLEGRRSCKFFSWLTWHVDSHYSPTQGTSAVLTPTQRAVEAKPGTSQLQ